MPTVHTSDRYKTGVRPGNPAKPHIAFADIFTGVLPAVPDGVDFLGAADYTMGLNNRFGTCGPTSVANSRIQTTHFLKGKAERPTDADVIDLYKRSGNPDFDPNTGYGDNGVVMQTMYEALLAGGIGGVKPLGFAKVNVAKQDELKAAIAIFGGLGTAVTLQAAQDKQTDRAWWDYSPSLTWGGHAILTGAYSSTGFACITWDKRVHMTPAFLKYQLDEAWVIIWPEHLQSKQFLQSIDVYKLADAYKTLTGRDFPAVLPPQPPPNPNPPPTPGTGWTIKTSGPVTITGTGTKPTVSTPEEFSVVEAVAGFDPAILAKILQILSQLPPAVLAQVLAFITQIFGPKK